MWLILSVILRHTSYDFTLSKHLLKLRTENEASLPLTLQYIFQYNNVLFQTKWEFGLKYATIYDFTITKVIENP